MRRDGRLRRSRMPRRRPRRPRVRPARRRDRRPPCRRRRSRPASRRSPPIESSRHPTGPDRAARARTAARRDAAPAPLNSRSPSPGGHSGSPGMTNRNRPVRACRVEDVRGRTVPPAGPARRPTLPPGAGRQTATAPCRRHLRAQAADRRPRRRSSVPSGPAVRHRARTSTPTRPEVTIVIGVRSCPIGPLVVQRCRSRCSATVIRGHRPGARSSSRPCAAAPADRRTHRPAHRVASPGRSAPRSDSAVPPGQVGQRPRDPRAPCPPRGG